MIDFNLTVFGLLQVIRDGFQTEFVRLQTTLPEVHLARGRIVIARPGLDNTPRILGVICDETRVFLSDLTSTGETHHYVGRRVIRRRIARAIQQIARI
jgi:hypothetical protein